MTAAYGSAIVFSVMDPFEIFATELDDGDEGDELRAVHAWRAQQLEQLGMSRTVAHACAGLVDWHQVSDLVRQGCALHLAVEIVR